MLTPGYGMINIILNSQELWKYDTKTGSELIGYKEDLGIYEAAIEGDGYVQNKLYTWINLVNFRHI